MAQKIVATAKGRKGDLKIKGEGFRRRLAILVMAGVAVGLGVFFLISRRQPEPAVSAAVRYFVWSIDMWKIQSIAVSLPREGKKEAWIKHADQFWYFDRPNGPLVNLKRWGGGIPLLLSGPGAERLIAKESTISQLESYGLEDPRMEINLRMENKDTITADVGDSTPDGEAYYIRLANSKVVYTVDRTWCEVIERLVRDPPYPEPNNKHSFEGKSPR